MAILNDLIDRSVKFGGIFYPARSLQSVLGKFTTNLCVWAHDETHKVRLVGTAIPIRYRGRYFLVCSAHQLESVDPKDICVLYPDGSLAVTCSGLRTFEPEYRKSDTDAYDIAALEFTEPVKEHPLLRSLFYDLFEIPPEVSSDRVVALVVAGYPTADQLYELEEKNHLGTVKRNVIALLDGQPEDLCLLRGKFPESLEFDPDGLSGSPVFVVQLNQQFPEAYLAGMVLRAGADHFYFLKVGFVRQFLDGFLATSTESS